MRQNSFFIERNISLAFVCALLVQAAGAVWWVSAREAADVARDRRLTQVEQVVSVHDSREIEIIERLARLEAHAESQNQLLRQLLAQGVKEQGRK